MAIREIDKARKRFFRVLAAALGQRRAAIRRHQIGPGVPGRANRRRGAYGGMGFCAGKQEIARRKQKRLARCGRIGRLVLSPYQ